MRTATFQFSEASGLLNGPDLFIELPSCRNPYQHPHSLNASLPPSLHWKPLSFHCIVLRRIPSPKSSSYATWSPVRRAGRRAGWLWFLSSRRPARRWVSRAFSPRKIGPEMGPAQEKLSPKIGFSWETDFLPLLVLMRRGRSTGKNQYW